MPWSVGQNTAEDVACSSWGFRGRIEPAIAAKGGHIEKKIVLLFWNEIWSI